MKEFWLCFSCLCEHSLCGIRSWNK